LTPNEPVTKPNSPEERLISLQQLSGP